MSELRAALASRGLPSDGLKADLANRLQARLDEEEFGMDEVTPPTAESKEVESKEEAPTAQSAAEETKEEAKEEVAAPAEAKAVARDGTNVEGKGSDAKATEDNTITPVVESESKAEGESKTEEVSAAPKATAAMSFEEKRKARAARFGIPVKDTPSQPKPKQGQTPKGGNKKGVSNNKKNQKRKSSGGGNEKKGQGQLDQKQNQGQGQNKKQKQDGNKKQKDAPAKKATEQPLLPKDEIMRRLERAQKFGTGNTAQIDSLKAQLRRHRFK